jgi:hypothetical protein
VPDHRRIFRRVAPVEHVPRNVRHGIEAYAFERAALPFPVFEGWNADREFIGSGGRARPPQIDELPRVAERQRPQQDAVDDAEDRAVSRDAHGERQDGYGGEGPVFAEAAERVGEVLGQVTGKAETERAAAVLLHDGDASELGASPPRGVGAAQSAADEVVCAGVEVEAQFVVHIGFERVAAQDRIAEGAEPGAHLMPPAPRPSRTQTGPSSRALRGGVFVQWS